MSQILAEQHGPLWIAHVPTIYGYMELLCGEEVSPDEDILALVTQFLEGETDHIAVTRKNVFGVPMAAWWGLPRHKNARVTKKCTRVADRAFPEVTVTWRQPGDFSRYLPNMKLHLIIGMLLSIAGCGATNPSASKEIRAGDSMKSVLLTLKEWNASEYTFDRYTVTVPFEGETAEHADRRREQYYADNPFASLPGFQLPNGLIVTLHSSGQTLTSITKELPGESKEASSSIDGFVGLRYHGDWQLTPSVGDDASESK